MMAKRNIFLQMFDIKPTDVFGNVDHGRIKKLQRIITIERKKTAQNLARLREVFRENGEGVQAYSHVPHEHPKAVREEWMPAFSSLGVQVPLSPRLPSAGRKAAVLRIEGLEGHNFLPSREEIVREIEVIEERDRKLALLGHLTKELERGFKESPSISEGKVPKHESVPRSQHIIQELDPCRDASGARPRKLRRPFRMFFSFRLSPVAGRIVAGVFIGALFFGSLTSLTTGYISRTSASVRKGGLEAYGRLMQGVDAALRKDFSRARGDFSGAHSDLRNLGGVSRLAASGLEAIADIFSLTGSGTALSGVHVLDAAEYFAKAGEDLAGYAELFSKNGIGSLTPQEFIKGYLAASDLQQAKQLLGDAIQNLEAAEESLKKTDTQALPAEFQRSVGMLRDKIPGALATAKQFASFQDSLFDALGYFGPRKYLLVFQNNAEERPTGGFIGSYAVLDILDGKITKVFIDDVFNIDGQLVDKVIPPMPVQKISTAWSLHDANWFFDYPTSAKKIAWFYERTGGASVDGVIALTPAFLKELLALGGPISLPGYDLQLTQENFQDELSYLIEKGTAKKDGESSKVVLRDLGTYLLDELQARWKAGDVRGFFDSTSRALERRDLMLWVKEPAIEDFLTQRQWSGSVRVSDGDYLAVVHANINGYKTDRVITQSISHDAHILEDGSIVDTLTVTRTHRGAPDPRYNDLYEKVNADYMRVFVPKGSTLLDANGHTIEAYEPPINYAEANFTADPDVRNVESSLRIQDPSETQIFDEAGKTVFANWVYVSPGESVAVRYKYRLPWKIARGATGKYVMLAQKQAGEEQTVFNGSVRADGTGVMADGVLPQGMPFEKDIEYVVGIR